MADLNRYLRRFWRLVSPPGRPGPAGVPSDRARTITDEIGAVLESIDAVQEEAQRIRADAGQKARQRREEATERARRTLADARSRLDEERAAAQARHRGDVRGQAEAMLETARREAEAVRTRADRNVDEYAGRIAERLLELEIEEAD